MKYLRLYNELPLMGRHASHISLAGTLEPAMFT